MNETFFYVLILHTRPKKRFREGRKHFVKLNLDISKYT